MANNIADVYFRFGWRGLGVPGRFLRHDAHGSLAIGNPQYRHALNAPVTCVPCFPMSLKQPGAWAHVIALYLIEAAQGAKRAQES